tara:strand:+ start:670 stop:1509 length:840 start_codon:yes stop_codon:yes gene_type:complete
MNNIFNNLISDNSSNITDSIENIITTNINNKNNTKINIDTIINTDALESPQNNKLNLKWTTVHKPKIKHKKTVIPNVIKYRVLCSKYMKDNICPYGNNCSFAHSLEEQVIDKNKKFIFDIIDKKIIVQNYNPRDNPEIWEMLLKMTNLCQNCQNKTCLGGYNCKDGINTTRYLICKDDLKFGECLNLKCNKVHMSKYNFIPGVTKEIIKKNYNIWNNKPETVIKDNKKIYNLDKLLTEQETESELNLSTEILGIPLQHYLKVLSNETDSSINDSIFDCL